MKFWPYEKYTIESSLSLLDAIQALAAEVEPRKWFRLSRKHKPFQGETTNEGFKIKRIIHYNNSSLPIIEGSFQPTDSGIRVEIKMRLQHFVTVFMILFCCGLIAAVASMVFDTNSNPAEAIPVIILLPISYLLVTLFFWLEVKKAKPLLAAIFKQKMSTNMPSQNRF